jgi:hypothetical protein
MRSRGKSEVAQIGAPGYTEVVVFGGTVYIYDFIWLPDIIEKLESKHRVLPEEVEEVF